ncbi:MAG: hypothetical protein HPY69_21320 [Armatimonadetes bacterium]|nr:hypothetical protein [Armatimonadota bacterium]
MSEKNSRGAVAVLALCAVIVLGGCGDRARTNASLSPKNLTPPIPTTSRGPTLPPMAASTPTASAMEGTIELAGEMPVDGGIVLPPEALPMQTYRDPRYGYSISYPSQCWLVSDGDQGGQETRIAIAGLGVMVAGIAVAPEPQMTLDQVVVDWKNRWEGQRQGQLQEERAVINGHDALIVTGTTEGVATRNVFVIHNKMRYELAFATSRLFYNEMQPLIQAITGSLILSEPDLSRTPVPLPSPPATLWEAPPPGWCRLSIPGVKGNPIVSQSRAVWCEQSNPSSFLYDRVFVCDLPTGQVRQVAEPTREGGQVIPAYISGDWIVWLDYRDPERGSDWMIFALNIETDERRMIAQNAGLKQFAPIPRIQGNLVVWVQSDGDSQYAIRLYDLATGQTSTLLAPSSYWLAWPAVFGDTVVYLKGKKAQDGSVAPRDVYVYDLHTQTERRVSSSGKASQPAVWGDYVVWLEDYLDDETKAGVGSNVFLHHLSSGQTQQLTRGERADIPSVGDRFVTWRVADGSVSAYDLTEQRLITIDDRATDNNQERSVYGAYAAERAIAWYWVESNALDAEQKTEIRVVAPCAR